MKLLFINSFKGLRSKKIQMMGIIFMVLLSTAIFTSMNLSLDQMENKYNDYLETQNVQDFGIEPIIDYKIDYTYETVMDLLNTKLASIPNEQKGAIMMYANCLKSGDEACFKDELMSAVDGIFAIYGANYELYSSKMDYLAEKYNFTYQYERTKVVTEEKLIYKFFPYEDKSLNIPYIISGRAPKNDNEITLLEKFAKHNKIKIGDDYTIADHTYKVVGYVYASDHIYPILTINSPFFDERFNSVVFTNPSSFDDVKATESGEFVARFNNRENIDDQAGNLFKMGNLNPNVEDNEFKGEKAEARLSIWNIISLIRINQPNMEFATNRLFAEYFLYFLLGIAVLIILIITKKRIEDEKLQIGVLKSLGYKSRLIATSYLTYPIIGSIIGGILGYFSGVLIHPYLTNVYQSYYNYPLTGINFDLKYLGVSILLPMIALSVLSYLISLFMLRHKPLYLLREGSNLKVNWFSKLVSKITSKLPFNSRFKYSLAARSFGKLAIISITSFGAGMLIVLTLVGLNLFNSMIDRSFARFNFDYMVTYNVPKENMDSKEEDYLYEVSMNLIKTIDSSGKETIRSEDDEFALNVSGIYNDAALIDIIDHNKKNLLPKLLTSNDMIINTNVKEILKVDVGDTLILNYNGLEYSYKIVGVQESFIMTVGFVRIDGLTSSLDYENPVYNKKYSNDKKYGKTSSLTEEELNNIKNVLALSDLKKNIEDQMSMANGSIYFVIGFASLMTLIIIAVIANIVVEENKKTISLMKVMGYSNKTISKIVLNIYTPFVVISYLLSIPVTLKILHVIVDALVGDMEVSIPIDMSPELALIGLASLLIGYYVAINLSRKALNKVPLAVALKRE